MPRWKEYRRYLEHNGWELYRTKKHYHYRKLTEDGKYAYTIASKGNYEIPPDVWKKILRRDLGITQEEFNQSL